MTPRTFAASVAALSLASAMLATTTVPAAAAEPAERAKPKVKTLAKGLVGPLSLDISRDGTRLFSQNFAGLLTMQEPGKEPKVIFSAPRPGLEVGAVSQRGETVRFAVSGRNNTVGRLKAMSPSGNIYTFADLYAFEKRANPDGGTTYGFRKVSKNCLNQVESVPALYKGIKETHPYATMISAGTTYVADAGANAILAVDRRGRVSTVAALPAMPAKVTQEGADALGLPECVVGEKYWFEPVPTDVEMGPDGWLYVTSLPGGPEDPSLGARGSVLKVNPATGRVLKVARGLITPTGLAVAKKGDIFVAQLFGGQIVRIKAGTAVAKPFVSVPLPSDVELSRSGMYALINALPAGQGPPNGKLVRIN